MYRQSCHIIFSAIYIVIMQYYFVEKQVATNTIIVESLFKVCALILQAIARKGAW